MAGDIISFNLDFASVQGDDVIYTDIQTLDKTQTTKGTSSNRVEDTRASVFGGAVLQAAGGRQSLKEPEGEHAAIGFPESFRIRIRNLLQLRSVYGAAAADSLVGELNARISAMAAKCGLGSKVEIVGSIIAVKGARVCPSYPDRRPTLEQLLCVVAAEPIRVGDVAVVVALEECTGQEALASAPSGSDGVPGNYLALMGNVVDAYQAVADGRLFFVSQPIRAVGDSELLYQEMLARIVVDPGDAPISPACFIPAMERLGLVRVFDRLVVHSAVAALRKSPGARLGCNISALSAIPDIYWDSLFEALAAEPGLAARLTIEVTETALLPSPAAAQAFFERLQALGCMVAIDDFGVGLISIGHARALKPNIIKIDGSFLRGAVDNIFCCDFLKRLVELSSQLAAHIVIEGVEDERHMQAAYSAGAHWVQGYFIGKPAFGCSAPVNRSTSPRDARMPAGIVDERSWAMISRSSSHWSPAQGDPPSERDRGRVTGARLPPPRYAQDVGALFNSAHHQVVGPLADSPKVDSSINCSRPTNFVSDEVT